MSDLIERIKRVNKESERINKESLEAQARKKVLEEQISELVSSYSQEYGIIFPNIENVEEFNDFLENLLNTTEEALEKEVAKAEKVNALIAEGKFDEAKELLDYVKFEKRDDVVVESESRHGIGVSTDKEPVKEEEVEKEKKELPSESVDLNDLDDLEEEPVHPRIKKHKRVKPKNENLSDFDMGVSLDELDKVADVTPKKRAEVVEETTELEEEPVRPRIRKRRRPVVVDDLEEEDIDDVAAPIKSGGSFSFD